MRNALDVVCEKFHQRRVRAALNGPRDSWGRPTLKSGAPFQVRTSSGRLVFYGHSHFAALEASRAGRGRIVWDRFLSFGRVKWLAGNIQEV